MRGLAWSALILFIFVCLFFPAAASADLTDVSAVRLPAAVDDSFAMGAADLNGSNGPDLAVANHGQSRILINDGSASFSDLTATLMPVMDTRTMAVARGDVDGDTDIDLVLANAYSVNRVLLNDGSGALTDAGAGAGLSSVARVSMDVVLYDVDGDHDLDLIVANRDGQNQLYINDGSGVFSDETATRLPALNDRSYAIAVADVDGNGTPDLFIGNDGEQDRLLLNNGLGVFTDATATNLPVVNNETTDAVFVDVDGDGDLDLALASGAQGVSLWLNNGGVFSDAPSQLPAINDFVIKLASADLDYDGDPDLFLANAGQDHALLNDGSGTFTLAPAAMVPSDTRRSFGLALTDLDGDVDSDVAIATPSGQNRLLLNNIAFPRIQIAVTPSYIEVGDTVTVTVSSFDEDGVSSTTLDVNGTAVPLVAGVGTFVPTTVGLHTATVTSSDTLGNIGTRAATFDVQAADTTPPSVTLVVTAPTPWLVGQAGSLDLTATDDRAVASTSLTANGANIPLDSAGHATFTPVTDGAYTFIAGASDLAGNTGSDTQVINVFPDTVPPTVSVSASPDPVDLAQTVTLAVTASDNVAVASEVLHLEGPGTPAGGEDLPIVAGTASYVPYQPGTYTATLTATDPSGNSASSATTFDAVGVPDTTAPVVSLTLTPATLAIGDSSTILVSATDDVAVASTSLTINGTPVALDGAGTAVYTPPVLGDYTVVAVASDPTGNESSVTKTLRAVDPAADTVAPDVAITAPVNDQELSGTAVAVTGTANDDTLVSYDLAYAPVGTTDFITFATGDTPVIDAQLGTLDTSLLENGVYEIRLRATDVNGLTTLTSVVVNVVGNLKLGQFVVAFDDKRLKIGNFPLTVTRSYDSRKRATVGDFGFGWNVSFMQAELVENRSPADGWTMDSGGGLITTYTLNPTLPHTVTIKFGENTEYRFRAQPNPESQQLFPIQTLNGMDYVAIGDGGGTLVPTTQPDWYLYGQIQTFDFNPYNPTGFVYTADDGYIYRFSSVGGSELRFHLTSVTDPNGVTMTISASGFTRSDGVSVGFTRDAQGRIIQLDDPEGNAIHYEYDAGGNLAAVVDGEGNRTEYFYDANHFLTEIQDPLGRPIQRQEYDADGRLIAITDADGNRIEMNFDLAANSQIVRDRRGNTTIYEYDAMGNVVRETQFPEVDGVVQPVQKTQTFDTNNQPLTVTDANGVTTTFTYDVKGNLTQKVVDAGGLNLTETTTYDSQGQVLTATDARGNTTTNTYGASGHLLTHTDRNGSVTTYTYDGSGRQTRVTDALGNYTVYGYDSVGNRTSEDRFNAADVLQRHMEYTYDANGNKLTETTMLDSGGTLIPATTTYTYDNNGQVTSTTDPMGNVTQTIYDAAGNKVTEIDPLNHHTDYTYDNRNNLVRVDYPDGSFQANTYDVDGNKVSTTDRNGNTTNFAYDALNHIVQVTLPDGNTREKRFDAVGNVIGEIDELGQRTDHTYDAAGRRIQTTQPLVFDALTAGNLRPVTQYEYDGNGNRTAVTDANGQTTTYTYDGENRLLNTTAPDATVVSKSYDAVGQEVTRTDAMGAVTEFDYDALGRQVATRLPPPQAGDPAPQTNYVYDTLGNLIEQTDANGHTTTYTYDLAGHKLSRTLPGGQTESFVYNAAGLVDQWTDFNGDAVDYTYNAVGRETRRDYSDGTSVITTYLGGGQRAQVTDGRGDTVYGYDAMNRLVSVTDPDGIVVGYTYDATGKQASITTPAGTTAYGYDALQRLSSVTDIDSGVTSYAYDAVGNLKRVTQANGNVTEYSYNTRNQLTQLVNKRADSSVITSYDYTLNNNGLRTAVAENDGSAVNYTYDGNYRLTQETRTGTAPYSIQYSYDAVGNRLTSNDGILVNYSYDANDRLLSAGGNNYTYDANGNLLSSDVLGLGLRTFAYDKAHRLNHSVAPDTSTVDFGYDADGGRVSASTGGSTVRYVLAYQNLLGMSQVIEERDGSSVLASYTYGHDLLSQKRGGQRAYYLYDGLGSTRALTNASETVTDTYVYDAYGKTVASTGTTVNQYRFTGEQLDPVIGLYVLRARYYDPSTGRFISMDPLAGDPQSPISLHRYVYAGDNPVNYVDPKGQQFSLVSVSISISINANLQSIYTQNLLKFFIKATKIAFCQLEPAYKMQSMGLLMIASNVPGGFDILEHSRKEIQAGYQAIGMAGVAVYEGVVNDLVSVDVKVGGLLGDLIDSYQSGSVPVPVPGQVQQLIDFKNQIDGWMGNMEDALHAVTAAQSGDTCGLFKILDQHADDVIGLIPGL